MGVWHTPTNLRLMGGNRTNTIPPYLGCRISKRLRASCSYLGNIEINEFPLWHSILAILEEHKTKSKDDDVIQATTFVP